MTDRDELARAIGDALDDSSEEHFGYSDTKSVSWTTLDGKWDLRETADHLIAAGYRKPRTITTLEELNSLPVGSVIRDPNGSVGELADGSRLGFPRFIHWTGVDFPDTPVAGLNLPATVLYVPEEQS